MTRKPSAPKRSMAIIGGCLAVVVLVLAVVLATSSSPVLVFVVPCMLMLGAMVWMMGGMGGMGGKQR